MGLLQHVPPVFLVYVIVFLLDPHSAEWLTPVMPSPTGFIYNLTAYDQAIDDCNDLILGDGLCKYSYGNVTHSFKSYDGTTARFLHDKPIQFKDNASSGSVFSFGTKFVALVWLGSPSRERRGYGASQQNALEGFTFALLPTQQGSLCSSDDRTGGEKGYLGLLNATSNGNNQSHIVAVEFDFVESPEFSDPLSGFHLGLNVNSMNSISSTSLQAPKDDIQLWQLQVWIDYDGSSQTLNVSTLDITDKTICPVSDSERPQGYHVWSQTIDLSTVVSEYMCVGFTSSQSSNYNQTQPGYWGPGSENYREDLKNFTYGIYSWSFSVSNSTAPAPASSPLQCLNPHNSGSARPNPLYIELAALVPVFIILVVLYRYRRRQIERREWRFNIEDGDLGVGDPHKFSYKELALATKNFDPRLALGRGGFGSVYKGFLPGNKQDVAIKRVSPDSSQGEREFLAEIMSIGKVRHRNLVRLQGWCHEKRELLLVYDYMPHGSLDKLLFCNQAITDDQILSVPDHGQDIVSHNDDVVVKFPWDRRFKVIVDVATALVYLHTECEERIIHRDVKSANVMLDAKFNLRLGDFGLARSYNHSLLTPESTNVAGTFGYLAPELGTHGFHTGKQTEQTDVYSFGAFLLEVACGKKPIYHDNEVVVLLVDHVWEMWGNSQILNTADPNLAGMYDADEMTKVLCLGLLCSHPSPGERPSMRQVLLMLNGDVSLPHVPPFKPIVGVDTHRTSSHDRPGSWSTSSAESFHTA
ncbi:hypothetical protein KC19_8G187300 [Ceratodon purpureus]|uniref:Protein kinase domain-containing protein n=1 Tax=Ceratodon purpureus TaxID=3225 RepID=A0A8T0H8K5_CERPU|nr:hypothetical protein KC19_8G187300 [Ceratodon purpureus]